MLCEIFYWVINASIIGSILCGLVMLISKIKAVPRFGVYLLWSVPFLRFWIPIGIASPFSLLTLISHFTGKTVVVHNAPQLTMLNLAMVAESYSPFVLKSEFAGIFNVLSIVWIVIALALILFVTVLYFNAKKDIGKITHIKENIYTSEKITQPIVHGVFRPKIILPCNISVSELEYILLHEQTHIRRKDNLWKLLAVITICFHWFNPFMIFFAKSFFAVMEIACDAFAVKRLDTFEKKEYALAVLNSSREKNFLKVAFGAEKTKTRIENIINGKSTNLISKVISSIFIVVAIYVLITNSI